MKQISLIINGVRHEESVEPRTHLADFMRGKLGLTGTHLGCEQGVCGACTVYIDGVPMRSCLASAAACDGKSIETVEGFAQDSVMEDLREAFSEHHALQCGFCTPGMLVAARDIAARLDAPDRKRIRYELSGNLCRCTGYQGIVEAIASVIEKRRDVDAPSSKPARASAMAPRSAASAAPPLFTPEKPTPPDTAQDDASGRDASVTATAPTMEVDADGWTVLRQTLTTHYNVQTIWDAFEDVPALARCMPGAEVTSVDGDRIEGRLRVSFGPISASFNGQAERRTDASALTGVISGSGADSSSGTRAQGEVCYQVLPGERSGAAVKVEVRFKLSGALAQFSRAGLIKDFAARLTDRFTVNLSRLLAGETLGEDAASGSDLNAVQLVFSVLWARIKALFQSR